MGAGAGTAGRRTPRMTDEFDEALALANGHRPDHPTRRPAAPLVPDPADAPDRRPAPPHTWESARTVAYRSAVPLPPRRLPLERALGHTLAAPLTALTDLPAFDTSAMDGWAVSGPGPWELAGPGLLAGAPGRPERLADGQAVRIATGARVPDGTTGIVRAEHGTARAGRLRGRLPRLGADIRPRAQECRSGAELLPAGTRLAPAALGLAAAAGYDELDVHPLPRAEVLVLGDELLHRGLPHDGRIRDALGPMTGPWLAALGAEVLVTRRLGDDADALREAIETSRADLIVTTGGTASGPVDHLRATLRTLGATTLVGGVTVRPGHPMLLAELPDGGTPVVGLPGNPLAAVAGLLTLAAPLLHALSGRMPPTTRAAVAGEAFAGHREDTHLVPVRRPADGGPVLPLNYAGPAMLRGIAAASALAVVPPGGLAPHDPVQLLELPGA
ncbi:molybdopterin molybdotransferase MoeA [Streptomyces carpaticus]|nr:molybdopterin molybdotransferase MoeA [Streptomyces carpaticus]